MIKHGQFLAVLLLIVLICCDIISGGISSQDDRHKRAAQQQPYHWQGAEQGYGGELTPVQKQILENGGTRVTQDGVKENIQPLRVDGEDPLRLRLVLMAEVSKTGKGNATLNSTAARMETAPQIQERIPRQARPIGFTSSGNLRINVGSRPNGRVMHLPEKGILVERQTTETPAMPPESNSKNRGRLSIFRNLSGGPSKRLPRPEPVKQPSYRPAPSKTEETLSDQNIRKSMYRPSIFTRGYTPMKRLTAKDVLSGNVETQKDTAQKQSWDTLSHNDQRSHAESSRPRYSDPGFARNEDPYRHGLPRIDGHYGSRQNDYHRAQRQENPPRIRQDTSYVPDMQPAPSIEGHYRTRGDPQRPTRIEYYRVVQEPQRTPGNGQTKNEAGQVRKLGSILSDMGQPTPVSQQGERYRPSSAADSRPYPVQYTIPESNTKMRVRRIEQPIIENGRSSQPIYVQNEARRPIQEATQPQSSFQRYQQSDPRQISQTIPDNYSGRVRSAQDLPSSKDGHFSNQGNPLQSSKSRKDTYYAGTRQSFETQARDHKTGVPGPTASKGSSIPLKANPNEKMVLISVQENADGTMTYTVADPRKVNVDKISKAPVPVRKPKPVPIVVPVYDSQRDPYKDATVTGQSGSGYPYQNREQITQKQAYPQTDPVSNSQGQSTAQIDQSYHYETNPPQNLLYETNGSASPHDPRYEMNRAASSQNSQYDSNGSASSQGSHYATSQSLPSHGLQSEGNRQRTQYEASQPQYEVNQQASSHNTQYETNPAGSQQGSQYEANPSISHYQTNRHVSSHGSGYESNPQTSSHHSQYEARGPMSSQGSRPGTVGGSSVHTSAVKSLPVQEIPTYESQRLQVHDQPFHTVGSLHQTREGHLREQHPNTNSGTDPHYFHRGSADPQRNAYSHPQSPYKQEPITYVETVTSSLQQTYKEHYQGGGDLSKTNGAQSNLRANYTIDDGVVYSHQNTNPSNTTEKRRRNPFLPNIPNAPSSSWNYGEQQSQRDIQRGTIPNQRSISEPAYLKSDSVTQSSSRAAQQDQPRAYLIHNPSSGSLTVPATPPSSVIQPTGNKQQIDVLKDIVKLTGNNTKASVPMVQQTRILPPRRQEEQGHSLIKAATSITKIKVLKSLECIPVTFSTTQCEGSCLPFQHCVTGGSVLFCCPPLVTESVVRFKMMQRSMEGMSDTF